MRIGDSQRRGHLLKEDDGCYSCGEPFHQGGWKEPDIASCLRERHDYQSDAGHCSDHQCA